MAEEMKKIILNIDRNLANNFKSIVAKQDNTMSEILTPLVVKAMSDYIQKAEEEFAAIQKATKEMPAKIT